MMTSSKVPRKQTAGFPGIFSTVSLNFSEPELFPFKYNKVPFRGKEKCIKTLLSSLIAMQVRNKRKIASLDVAYWVLFLC